MVGGSFSQGSMPPANRIEEGVQALCRWIGEMVQARVVFIPLGEALQNFLRQQRFTPAGDQALGIQQGGVY